MNNLQLLKEKNVIILKKIENQKKIKTLLLFLSTIITIIFLLIITSLTQNETLKSLIWFSFPSILSIIFISMIKLSLWCGKNQVPLFTKFANNLLSNREKLFFHLFKAYLKLENEEYKNKERINVKKQLIVASDLLSDSIKKLNKSFFSEDALNQNKKFKDFLDNKIIYNLYSEELNVKLKNALEVSLLFIINKKRLPDFDLTNTWGNLPHKKLVLENKILGVTSKLYENQIFEMIFIITSCILIGLLGFLIFNQNFIVIFLSAIVPILAFNNKFNLSVKSIIFFEKILIFINRKF